ncbi:GerAB/ArcD/ProY family transporter [Clostridium botulinum]|nr:GerAB/ArcD/ProY family transporter [Clostridium botulinum]
MYIWLSFVSIYYLGADVAKNLYWPTLSLAETIAIPGISNFKFVFMFLWSNIIFKTIANQNYFFIIHCLVYLKNKFQYFVYDSIFLCYYNCY